MQVKLETRVGLFVLAALVILAYMGFYTGTVRFDSARFHEYIFHCQDISGLSRKADVKIAGVKVGYVQSIELAESDMQVEVHIMIPKRYSLYENARAFVRQEGMLGPKYLDIIPGSAEATLIMPGSSVPISIEAAMSIDEMMHKFKQVVQSAEAVINNQHSVDTLQGVFVALQETAQQLASFSRALEQSIVYNADNIQSLLTIGNRVHSIADQLEQEILPVVANNIIDTSECMQEGILRVNAIFDEQSCLDVKRAIRTVSNTVTTFDSLQFIFDSHVESMHHKAEHWNHADAKGYCGVRIHPREDFFWLFQIIGSERGFINRKLIEQNYSTQANCQNCPVNTNQLDLPDWARLWLVDNKAVTTVKRNKYTFGAQVGKIFSNVALRAGLFESTAGAAVDVQVPVGNENFRWVSTFEAYDFRGWNRIDDRRPHLKWLNKMFLFKNIYLVFGADDFVSKCNANAFFGAGIRFGDEDFDYLFKTCD